MSGSLWLVAVHIVTGERRYLRVEATPRVVGRPSRGATQDKLTIDFDPNLSRSHFAMHSENGTVHIRRAGSSHPLYFAGQELDSFEMRPGEHFNSGETRFELRLQDESIERPPTLSFTITPHDNARALAHDSHRCLRAVLSVQALLASGPDADTLFRHLGTLVAQVVPAAATVMVVAVQNGPDSVAFETIAAHGSIPLTTPSRTLLRSAIDCGQPVFHAWDEVAATADRGPTAIAGVKWVLAAPILPRDGQHFVLYTVGFDSYGSSMGTERTPGELDRAVLPLIANVLTQYLDARSAVQLQMQVEIERSQRAMAETMRDLSNELTSTLHLADVLERLLDGLQRVFPYEQALGLLRREGAMEVTSVRHLPASLLRMRIPLSAPLLLDVQVDAVGSVGLQGVVDPPHGWLRVPILWTRSEAVGEEMRGLLLLARDRPVTAPESDRASVFAAQASIAFRNAALFEEVQRLATTDALTGIFNRGHFLACGEDAAAHARDGRRHLAAIMLDVDHFKRFNDTHGHAVGDRVLQHVVRCCVQTVRHTDMVGRIGGEEIAIIIDGDLKMAAAVAERIRASVAEPICVDGRSLLVTASLGVAHGRGDTAALSEVLMRADHALYAAKNGGRNRVCAWEDERPAARELTTGA